MSAFGPPANRPPVFAGVRAAPGQKYAVEKAKQQLKAIYREARATKSEPLTEAAAHSYLLGATYVLDRRFISEEIPVKDFASIMHCDSRTARRARQRLVADGLWEIIEGGQGSASIRIKMPVLVGPIFAEKGGAAAVDNAATSDTRVRSSREPRTPESEVASRAGAATSDTRVRSSQQPRAPESEVAAADYLYPEEEEDLLLGAEESPDADVAQVCNWWEVEYPRHNGGVLNEVRESDRNAAFTLLFPSQKPRRTVKRVREMAGVLWDLKRHVGSDRYIGIGAADRAYIATTDRSICTLRTKASIIEKEVVRLGLDASSAPQVDTYESTESGADPAQQEAVRLEEERTDEASAAIDALPPAVRDALSVEANAELAQRMNRSPALAHLGMEPSHYERVLRLAMVRLFLERENDAVWAERLAAARRAG